MFFGYRLRMESDRFLPEDDQIIDMTAVRRDVDARIKANAINQKQIFETVPC